MAQSAKVSGPISTDSLSAGTQLRSQGKFKEAKDFFKSYLGRHPDNQAAYVYLYSCADTGTTPDIVEYFKSLPKQAARAHKLLLANLYLREGNTQAAKNVNNDIIAANPKTSLAERAKLNNFYIALYNDNDPQTASSILNDIEQSSSLSTTMEISDAEHSLAVYVGPKTGTMPRASFKRSANSSQDLTTSDLQEQSGLLENYPNPFNPSTTIRYQLPKPGMVSVKVYDVLGQEVATLVNSYQESGTHTVNFNGDHLASGIYFYRLTAPGITIVKKMLMTK